MMGTIQDYRDRQLDDYLSIDLNTISCEVCQDDMYEPEIQENGCCFCSHECHEKYLDHLL